MHRTRRALLAATVAVTLATTAVPAPAVAQPTPDPSETAQQTLRPADVLHGEGTVQTRRGEVRVAVQQGTTTGSTGTGVTVRSPDGFTRTWQVGDATKVVSARSGMQPGRLGTGARVFVAGTVQGSGAAAAYSASYVLVHHTASAEPGPTVSPTTG